MFILCIRDAVETDIPFDQRRNSIQPPLLCSLFGRAWLARLPSEESPQAWGVLPLPEDRVMSWKGPVEYYWDLPPAYKSTFPQRGLIGALWSCLAQIIPGLKNTPVRHRLTSHQGDWPSRPTEEDPTADTQWGHATLDQSFLAGSRGVNSFKAKRREMLYVPELFTCISYTYQYEDYFLSKGNRRKEKVAGKIRGLS